MQGIGISDESLGHGTLDHGALEFGALKYGTLKYGTVGHKWSKGNRLRSFLCYSFLLCGLVFIGKGLWIPIKAKLAQVLIADAWQKTLNGQQTVKPWPWADTWPVANLQWRSSGINLIVLAGTSGHALAFGPGHMTASVMPGDPGSSVIAGHRDTHFAFLETVSLGDTLTVFNKKGNAQHFRITELLIINSETDQVQFDRIGAQLILVTCYPFDAIDANGPMRYIVKAEAVQAYNF
jgi:sortase A